MGLLDKKSKSKNMIKIKDIDGNINFVWYDYDNMPNNQEAPNVFNADSRLSDILGNKFGLRKNVDYPVSILIDADLDDYDFNSGFYNKCIRDLLQKMNLVNEKDRLIMNELGIRDEHAYLDIKDTTLPKNIIMPLVWKGKNYLWQVVNMNSLDLSYMSRIGEKSIRNIQTSLNAYGYSLRDYAEKWTKPLTEEDQVRNHIKQIIKAKKAYKKQMDKIQAKMDRADANLAIEEAKLVEITRKNK